MANKQGTNQIVDAFIGDKLIEARYIGQTKYFDPYTTLTGTLPLTFNSRVAGALKNYRLYGDSDGVGEKTENLWSLETWSNSTVDSRTFFNATLTYQNGSTVVEAVSLPIMANGRYSITLKATDTNYDRIRFRHSGSKNDLYIGSILVSFSKQDIYTITFDVLGFDASVINGIKLENIMLTKGSTAPTTYIPYGYKIPLLNSVDYEYKEVHKDTVTIDGVVWDILGYNHDEVYDNNGNLAKQSVTIQTHDCFSELQFDAKEALFAFPEGLAAGTYHFTVSQQPWYAGDVGKIMQFTLANAIPAGGVIVLGNSYNATMIGSTISVYASCSATTATETVTISEGSDGTDLGSVGNAISGNTNSIQRALLGNNNYNESAIRQYLNSDGTAGTYWTPQNKWDRPPSWNASTSGFLRWFNSDFVSAIGKTSKRTAKNTVSDGGGYIDTEEKVFLLSRTEIYAGANNSISEGTAYKYYSDYSNLSSAGTGADSNRIKYRNNVAKYWWLRSPLTGYAYTPFHVSSSGTVISTINANNVSGVAPAVCIPLDNINNEPYLQSLFLKPKNPNAQLPYISNNDLFIGDTKLYEDEYVDFSEQKIYRTIILTTHDNKGFITSDNKRFCVRRTNNG